MTLRELTKQLCGMAGPSGFEAPVRDWIAEYLRPFADEIKTDALGNVIAIKRCGRPEARMLMLDAHMDEIGFVITGAENGFLKFASIGGVDQRMLPAREIRILTEPPLFGVIDTMPPHLLSHEEMEKSIDPEKLYIDIGMSQEQAEKAVPPGTPAVYSGGCQELGTAQLCGKALDDRSCAAIIIKAFEELAEKAPLGVDLCCLVSAQEEVGCRGARVGAWNAAPDYAIVVDVTFAKTPDAKNVLTEAGKGVAIGIGPNMNGAMTRAMFALAEKNGIPHQTEVCPGGHSGINAEVIQISRDGVATALLSLPLKYMHTPLEAVRYDDMESVLKLIVAYAESLEV